MLYNNNYGNKYIKNKEKITAYDEIIKIQEDVDKEIDRLIGENYTLKNAKVLINPYKISPLTALIIFKTSKEETIDVYINDEKVTTMEKSKNHIVPIYGLKENYKNIVKLVGKKDSQEYEMQTPSYEGNPLIVEKSDKTIEDLYLISTNFTSNRIYDRNGELKWYIDGNYAGDIEYINNDTFYISDNFQGVNGVKINYPSFLKMNYLGKILEEYVSDYGYHHELVPLKNDKMLVLGYDDNSKYLESVIYIMDLKTGEVTKKIDMYDVFAKIDRDWSDSFKNNFDFVCNSAQYNEKTGDLLLSSRGFNSIIMINLNTEKIKWIFGDPKFYSEKFSKYLLKYDGDYPAGQHTAHLDGNRLSLHNNDYNMFKIKNTMADYKNKQTTAEEYEINGNTIKKVWEYDANEFSKVAGSYSTLNNKNKLITYGWSISKNVKGNVSINDEEYLNGKIIELDEKENILFKAKTKDLIYRTYKVNLYGKNTKNYEVYKYKKISALSTPKYIKTSSIANKLQKSEYSKIGVKLYTSRISIDSSFNPQDEVNIYLIAKDNRTYKYNYKKKNQEAPTSINTSLNTGEFAIYIEINDKIYDLKKVIIFK